MFNCVYCCVMKWTLQFSWRWVKLCMASTVTFPFGTCGEHTTLSFLNCSHEFLVNKDSSCNTRSYEMVISSCLDFQSLFFSGSCMDVRSYIYWKWCLSLRWRTKARRNAWNCISFFSRWEQLVVIMFFVGCVWDTAPWIFGPYNHGN